MAYYYADTNMKRPGHGSQAALQLHATDILPY